MEWSVRPGPGPDTMSEVHDTFSTDIERSKWRPPTGKPSCAQGLAHRNTSRVRSGGRTPALDRLGLPERGVPRIVFEDGLQSHAVDPCEEIGRDPFESTVPRVPFDAYPRLASPHGQRREQLWTDFDGYQVTRELPLHALVGANVQCDGAGNFCASAARL